MYTSAQEYLIALGSNLPSDIGSPARTVQHALDRLNRSGCRVAAVSRLYRTPCFPAGAGPDYVNAAARLMVEGTPADCLARLHAVEAELGRLRVQRWGQRTLDLDLLAAGGLVLPDRESFEAWRRLPLAEQVRTTPECLILPHPRLQDRAFVLVPLAEIAADWMHPVLGQSVTEMLAALPGADVRQVVAL